MKRIDVTIEEEVWNWLNEKSINKSAWVRAIIKKIYTQERINVNSLSEEEAKILK